LYTSCVLGLRPSAFFNEFLLIKKKEQSDIDYSVTLHVNKVCITNFFKLANQSHNLQNCVHSVPSINTTSNTTKPFSKSEMNCKKLTNKAWQ